MANSLVFIDSRVKEKDLLISCLSPEANYHILDPDHDGISQMVDFLSCQSGLDSIRILSHGTSGSMTIGNTLLNIATLKYYSSPLAEIGYSLHSGGDLLLYGCNIGAGDAGHNFIQALSQLTGADVAASDDLTGDSSSGGDWELEISSGAIESPFLTLTAGLQEYTHTLGAVADYFLAQMSLAAYYDDPANPSEKESPILYSIAKQSYAELLDEGWQIADGSPHKDGSMAATVFENGDSIVIAFRGAEHGDSGDYLANAATDATGGVDKSSCLFWHQQFTDALTYANEIRSENPDKEIYVTGHGLGGVLAQVVSQMFGFSGATFDAGAAGNLAQGLNPDFTSIADSFGIQWGGAGVLDSFINYLIDGSVVSNASAFHVGQNKTVQKSDVPILNQLAIHYMAGIVEMMREQANHAGTDWYGNESDNVITGNAFSNRILAYAGNDLIDGGNGADTIDAGTGDDVIRGGAGDDSIEGGKGTDRAVFTGNFAEYDISLKENGTVFTVKDNVAGRDGTDSLTGVEFFVFADRTKASGDSFRIGYGDSQGECLYGNDSNNLLYGSAGNDIINGRKGDDTIDGGIGTDTVILSGNYSDYAISHSAGSSLYILTDRIPGRDGVDVVGNVENFRFADGTRSVGELIDDGVGSHHTAVYDISSSSGTFPKHTMGEKANMSAFAAVREDGSVVTWGASYAGGDSSAVSGQLNGVVDVVQLFSTINAFAALREDGSVVTWGDSNWGGDSSSVSGRLNGDVDVAHVFSTFGAFAALRNDGSVVTWGPANYGGDSSAVSSKLNGDIDVIKVFSTYQAFGALRNDGSVVTWGSANDGGDSNAVVSMLNGDVDVLQVFSTNYAFAALREDGSMVTWGQSSYGGNSSAVSSNLNGDVDVVRVFSTDGAFAALREDGSLVTWGYDVWGGDSLALSNQLNGDVDVVAVFSTDNAFAALRADGSVVTWGNSSDGGDSRAVSVKLNGNVDVEQIFSTSFAFAALRQDGSVVTWGNGSWGGNSSAVSSKLNGDIPVVQIFSTNFAFAALREDGSVVTWGDSSYGGDSSSVAKMLDGSVDVFQVFSTNFAFAALREDGSVVTWGNSAYGGDSSSVADKLHDVTAISDIYSNNTAGRIHEGTDNDDKIDCSYVDDVIWGNGGNDVLYAKEGDDLVFGGAGNDLFIGAEGKGNDTYDGGTGSDTVTYLSALGSLTVDLAEGRAYATDGHDAAGIGIDTLINIENIIAGNFDDLLIGDASASSIEGGLGNDTLAGGEGADTLDGGSGLDTADFSDKSLPVVVALNGSTDAIVSVGGVAEDTIRNIENLIGGDGNDFFTGDSADNIFRGGAGGDTLDGSAGSDTADYSEKSEAVVTALHGASDASVMVGGVAEDTIRNIENLIGGSGDDHFIGDAAANMLSGNAGDDLLEGEAGNDTIIGGFGDDTVVFTGNLADYLLSYDHVTDSYTVTDSMASRDGFDIVTGVEHFRFADATRDVDALLDAVAPSLSGITPSGYANDVPLDSSIVLTFTEAVKAGTGLIRVMSGGAAILSIDITDSTQVHIDGQKLTIDPSTNFSFKTSYQLQIDPGALTDHAGNHFAGLSDYEFKTVAGTRGLTGSVTYWKNDSTLDGSWIWLKEYGLVERIAGTDNSGTYACQGLDAGNYTIQAEKAASTDGKAVKANDALAALKIAFGINPNGAGGGDVSAYQFLAADVDRNGKVQAADALNILKMAYNMGSAPQKEWIIVLESVGSETMSRTNVVWPTGEIDVTIDQDQQLDLVGVLKGDVNGSWAG